METRKWREFLLPYEQATKELKSKFEGISNEYKRMGKYSPIEYVTVRVKKISSILEKAKKKNIALSDLEDKIEDVAGVRIMCQFVEDIDTIVEDIKTRTDMEVIYEKDYVSNVKASGYRSYHMIILYPVHTSFGKKVVQAEIQIRTLAMNFWATIEHSINYKYEHNIPEEIRERLVKASEVAYQLDTEMSKIRSEVVEAQSSFREKSVVIADILNNIRNISQVCSDSNEILSIQEEFYELSESGDVEKLKKFSDRLDKIAENYRAQSLYY